jgi:hypothetical protein
MSAACWTSQRRCVQSREIYPKRRYLLTRTDDVTCQQTVIPTLTALVASVLTWTKIPNESESWKKIQTRRRWARCTDIRSMGGLGARWLGILRYSVVSRNSRSPEVCSSGSTSFTHNQHSLYNQLGPHLAAETWTNRDTWLKIRFIASTKTVGRIFCFLRLFYVINFLTLQNVEKHPWYNQWQLFTGCDVIISNLKICFRVVRTLWSR